MVSRLQHGKRRAGGELALIERIRERAAGFHSPDVRLGIGDDCAILRLRRGEEMVITTDFSLEGRHFRRDWHPAASAGHRALARGLSDIAAMGARPVAAFLSLALPGSVARDGRWVDGFLDGLLQLAGDYSVPLAGGDTSGSPTESVLADIIVLGAVPQGSALRRSAARAGDGIYVTGALGGADAELSALTRRPKTFARAVNDRTHPHLFPQPRVQVGRELRRRKLAAACIDVSDGISTDLRHLCEASHVSARIEEAALPVHPLAARLLPPQREHALLHGGEDYELLFTARPAVVMPRSICGVPITRIGEITSVSKHPEIRLVDESGHQRVLERGGWEHLV